MGPSLTELLITHFCRLPAPPGLLNRAHHASSAENQLLVEPHSFDGGRSERSDDSLGAESGLSGEEEDRQRVVRKQDERKVEVAESRRGYVRGAVWDEGNMIQAMARLNP